MLLLALCALLLLLALASVCLGSVRVPLRDVLSALWGGEVPPRSYNIIRHVRLPRVLAALLVGAALSVSGAVLQAVLMNPLAGPNIIGVNAGSGFFVLGAAVLLPGRWDIIPLAAFAGALLACGIIYGLAVTTGASRITIVLAGVAVSGFFGAGSDAITTLVPDAWTGASTFLVGGFAGVTMENVRFALWYIAAGLALALLQLGDNLIGQRLVSNVHISRIVPNGNGQILLKENLVKAHGGKSVLAVVKRTLERVDIGASITQLAKIIPERGQMVLGDDIAIRGAGSAKRGVGQTAENLKFGGGCAAAKGGDHNPSAGALVLHPPEILV